MAPHRILQGHTRTGIWLRIALLQVIVSATTVLAVLAILGDPNRDAINATTCGLRLAAQPQIDRAQKVLDDPEASAAAKRRNQASIDQIRGYLAIYHTVPRDHKCPEPKPKKAKP